MSQSDFEIGEAVIVAESFGLGDAYIGQIAIFVAQESSDYLPDMKHLVLAKDQRKFYCIAVKATELQKALL